ncbi:MAG: CehA/McbA family metallohydrolase [Clostridia bacterium]|nr:CehA/McbA family metallohydrolase [Clostridia bacterium]
MYTDKLGNTWYKVGLHVHTNLTDGRVSPQESARIYKAAGFDAIAITDHWLYNGDGEIEGLKIISGCEYNLGGGDTIAGVMHIVGVGMKYAPDITRESSRQETIDKINEAGGIAIFAHPAWSLNSVRDAKELSGFSAIEIYNTVSDAHESTRPYSGYLIDVLANEGIIYPIIATDDAHYYDGTDEAKSFTYVEAKSLESRDIVSAIKEGKVYGSQGPVLSIKRDGDKIIADCSPCNLIAFLSNKSWSEGKTVRGEGLTHAEYKISDFEKWVRVEVRDDDGNYAWSSIIEL